MSDDSEFLPGSTPPDPFASDDAPVPPEQLSPLAPGPLDADAPDADAFSDTDAASDTDSPDADVPIDTDTGIGTDAASDSEVPEVRRVSPRDRKPRLNAARRSLFAPDWESGQAAPPLLPDQPALPPEPPASDAPFLPPEMRIEEALQANASMSAADEESFASEDAFEDDDAFADESFQDTDSGNGAFAGGAFAASIADDDLDAFIDELDSSLVRTIPPEADLGDTADDFDADDDLDAFIDELDSSLVRTIPPESLPSDAVRPRSNEERFPPLPSEPAAARYAGPMLQGDAPRLRPAQGQPPARPAQSRAREPRVREPGQRADGRLPPEEPPLPPLNPRGRGPNIISLILGGLALLVIGYIVILWRDPSSPLNPMPPFTPLPIIITATYTPTPLPTATETPLPTSTASPMPTATATLAQSPTPAPPTPDASGSINYPFRVQDGRALYLTNPDSRGGCEWASITGTVKTAEGQPLNDYRVRIVGTVGDTQFDEQVLTGSAPGFGPGGFELQIGRQSVDADFTIQLFDPQSVPVSGVFPFVTSSRCDWNVARLNFVSQ